MSKPIISKQLIQLDLEIDNKDELFERVINLALDNHYISDKQQFLLDVQKREQESATAVGYEIAMPHGKSDAVLHPFIAFVRLKNQFRWGEDGDDDELVRLIFLIGVPTQDVVLHLRFIQELSKALLDDDYRQRLINENDIHKIEHYLSQIKLPNKEI
ncbi:PTS sugar transporter subunit IIA [Lonepinella koalarum]|uniref:PTS system IIA component (Fru family) n=1 Tax=Lonepinella koalarum TaxID=53417 RepID=A0A4R1KX65_9PAST|nr:fructose PTS transporter subunit IIA [Lonepinella koalarum]MDH2927723.1 hypothetical protein [Lonepinella koalarum]TCK69918.1 PTS system IIA component (Fru family) [Lonepinella koalarum]TFJ90478.1 PTS sugar transporter subunit IIA [Lonepinella koalarum]TYG35174.1 PTS sugar transporter subunit IIA [Lonepinella koalarum]